MHTDPTLASKGTETVRPLPPGEDARLDDAIRRADDLLVQSLRVEERQRNRRKLRRWVVLPIGALIMLAAVYAIALAVGVVGHNKSAAPTDSPKTVQLAAGETAEAAAEKGWQLWGQRRLAQAESKFQNAVKLDPSMVNAWNGLGWSQFNQGKYAEAEKSFTKTIELEPGHAAAENGLGQLYLAQGKLDDAEQHLLSSSKTAGANAAYWGLAKVYLLKSDWDKAQQWAQKLVDAGQKDAQPLLDAAKAKSIPANLRRQIAPAATASAKKATPGTPTLQQGWMQLNKGQTTQAIATFKAILDKSPNDADALNGLGWAQLRTADGAADAKDSFEKALKANPDAAGSMNGLAICLKNEGKIDEAVKLWQKMVDSYPGPNAGTYGLASTYLERKEYAKAVPLFEQLAKADPNNEETKNLLKQAKEGAGK